MDCEKRPAQYIVRVWMEPFGSTSQSVEYRPWAHSAEDAKFQVEEELKVSSRSYSFRYVGPVNPDCKCTGACRCGVLRNYL